MLTNSLNRNIVHFYLFHSDHVSVGGHMEVQGDPGNLRTTMVYCVKRSITDTGEYAAVNIRVKLTSLPQGSFRTHLLDAAVWAGCSTPPPRAGGELGKTPCTLPLLSPADESGAHPGENQLAHPSFGTGYQ